MLSLFWSILVLEKLVIWTIHHTFIESKHSEVAKNPIMFCLQKRAKKQYQLMDYMWQFKVINEIWHLKYKILFYVLFGYGHNFCSVQIYISLLRHDWVYCVFFLFYILERKEIEKHFSAKFLVMIKIKD